MNIKYFNRKLSKNVQAIILLVLSVFYIYSSLHSLNGLYKITTTSFVVILVLMAVWTLFITTSHSNFASYFVLLILGYIDGCYDFVKWALSFNFNQGFQGAFPWIDLFLFVGSIYLIVMAISVFVDEGFTFNKECFNLDQLLILFPILMFLTYGMSYLLAVLVVEFVACNYRPVASHFLMLSKTIILPFNFVKIIVEAGFSSLTFGNWLLTIFAIYVIILLIIDFFKAYKEHKTTLGSCEISFDDKASLN